LGKSPFSISRKTVDFESATIPQTALIRTTKPFDDCVIADLLDQISDAALNKLNTAHAWSPLAMFFEQNIASYSR